MIMIDCNLLTPKPTRKRGGRRARQNKLSGIVTMSQTEAFENSLANRGADSASMRGKLLFTSTIGTSPSAVLALTPQAFGARAAAYATLFSSYRFKYLKIKFFGTQFTSYVTSAVGILDDATTTEGDAPTNINTILEQRCSASVFAGVTQPGLLSWSPVDGKKWFYTFTGVSGSDQRLTTNGVMYAAAGSAGTSLTIEVDFSISFKGAIDTASL